MIFLSQNDFRLHFWQFFIYLHGLYHTNLQISDISRMLGNIKQNKVILVKMVPDP